MDNFPKKMMAFALDKDYLYEKISIENKSLRWIYDVVNRFLQRCKLNIYAGLRMV